LLTDEIRGLKALRKQADLARKLMGARRRLGFIEAIAQVVRRQKLICMTIALSPECCGGWRASDETCFRIASKLGINFQLPRTM
jgi:hypothetical protein